MLLAMKKREEGSVRQGMRAASRSWKMQKTRLSPAASHRKTALLSWILAQSDHEKLLTYGPEK